ncbi:MAG TPA: SLC13 family permease [Chloroflexota bacterium]|jgi:di/tricarboxylate transporter
MPGDLSPQQVSVFAILVAAFALLISERLRNDVVALLIVLALYVTHALTAEQALSGFGSEPAIVVAGIFVLSASLHATGLSDQMGAWIGRLAGGSYTRIVAVIMPTVALLSAFTHHVTTTAIMLPVTLDLSREQKVPASKLLIPLSFAASLGTTITIIGAPAFLIASNILQQGGRPGLDVFSIAPIGLALSLAGTVYMLVIGRFLLPSRAGGGDQSGRFRLDDYFTEVAVLDDSPLVDKTIQEVEQDNRTQFNVVGWMRGGRELRRPFGDQRVRPEDVLLVRTTPEQIVAVAEEPGVELRPIKQYGALTPSENGNGHDAEPGEQLVQAVVAPDSEYAGRTIGHVDFRRRYDALVVALWRRRGWLNQEIAQVRLRPGDVLVLQGSDEALDRVANDRAFLMMVPFQGEARQRRKAPVAGLIMLATVLAAAFNLLSIEMAALAGALAVVLTRCISPGQAYRSIDTKIYVFVAGAIPLGTAMQQSGAADVLAGWLQGAVGGWSPVLILLVIYAVVAVLTQFMSDSATTALFGPVALSLAQALGQAPEPYVVTVAMASVVAFLTPIGHHGNLLVYGPGRYQFADFVRVGTPLTAIAGLLVVFIARLVWQS